MLIVGRESAGATLARLTAPHMRVLALAKKTEQGVFHKPCGGLLARALRSNRPEKTYNAATHSLRMKLAAKLLKCPFMYHPFLCKKVMQSGFRTLNE